MKINPLNSEITEVNRPNCQWDSRYTFCANMEIPASIPDEFLFRQEANYGQIDRRRDGRRQRHYTPATYAEVQRIDIPRNNCGII